MEIDDRSLELGIVQTVIITGSPGRSDQMGFGFIGTFTRVRDLWDLLLENADQFEAAGPNRMYINESGKVFSRRHGIMTLNRILVVRIC